MAHRRDIEGVYVWTRFGATFRLRRSRFERWRVLMAAEDIIEGLDYRCRPYQDGQWKLVDTSQQFFPSGPYEAPPRAEGKNSAALRPGEDPGECDSNRRPPGAGWNGQTTEATDMPTGQLLTECEGPSAGPLRRLTRSEPGG